MTPGGSGIAVTGKAKTVFEARPALSLDKMTSKGPDLIKSSCDSMAELDSSVILKNWEEALPEASTEFKTWLRPFYPDMALAGTGGGELGL